MYIIDELFKQIARDILEKRESAAREVRGKHFSFIGL